MIFRSFIQNNIYLDVVQVISTYVPCQLCGLFRQIRASNFPIDSTLRSGPWQYVGQRTSTSTTRSRVRPRRRRPELRANRFCDAPSKRLSGVERSTGCKNDGTNLRFSHELPFLLLLLLLRNWSSTQHIMPLFMYTHVHSLIFICRETAETCAMDEMATCSVCKI